VYSHSQFGWPMAVGTALGLGLATLVVLSVSNDTRASAPWAMAALYATLGLAFLLFYRLRVTVNAQAVRVVFGIGLISKEVPLAEVVRAEAVRTRPEVFEPKTRWAMDWYYPVLTGVLKGEAAKARLAEGWETFAMEGLGIRCVSDEPWITASETAECALAYACIGDMSTATDLLTWTRTHRRDDGSYWTGIVYPEPELFPFDEHTSYTAAAVVLAVDAITRATPASDVFVPF